ncbi:MAG TPA: alpha/beta hydrolase [Tepidisphaeraceae bacterium]|nr:alpha/beta hydrolase [Tepidisphaeraceae bacterium]
MKICSKITLLLFLSLISTACTPTDLASALVPPFAMTGPRNLSYLPGPRHELDIYRPTFSSNQNLPVVIWLYGGYWQNGSRQMYRSLAYPFTSAGYLVVIPDYRLYPDVRFPAFIDDAAAAVAWTRLHIASYGGDPSRIFLAGHSAGAYIAAMLNVDHRYLDHADVPAGTLKGVICLSAPLNFIPDNPALLGIFGSGTSPDYLNTQPRTFLTPHQAPMLLIQGDKDQLVHPGSNREFAHQIHEHGADAIAISYPQMGHLGPLIAMIWPLWFTADVRDRCLDFLHEQQLTHPSHTPPTRSSHS